MLAVADSAPDCAGLRGPQSTAGEGALSTGGPGEAGCTSLYPELRNESAGDDLRPQGVHKPPVPHSLLGPLARELRYQQVQDLLYDALARQRSPGRERQHQPPTVIRASSPGVQESITFHNQPHFIIWFITFK